MGLSVYKHKNDSITVSAKILKIGQAGFPGWTHICALIKIKLLSLPLQPQIAKLFQPFPYPIF
jgi:hypothetical protein